MAINLLLDRRRLLLGLAAASTAAASGTATATGSTATPAVMPENPDLLRLAEQLPAALAERSAATAHLRRIIEEWSPKWPSAPDALCDGYVQSCSGEGEKGLTGERILENGARVPSVSHEDASHEVRRANPAIYCPRYVTSAKRLNELAEGCRKSLRKKRPKHPLTANEIADLEARIADLSNKASLASTYEAQCERVRRMSGYLAAVDRKDLGPNNRSRLNRPAHRILSINHLTLAKLIVNGVVINTPPGTPLGGFAWKLRLFVGMTTSRH